jgi:hypothetical protein
MYLSKFILPFSGCESVCSFHLMSAIILSPCFGRASALLGRALAVLGRAPQGLLGRAPALLGRDRSSAALRRASSAALRCSSAALCRSSAALCRSSAARAAPQPRSAGPPRLRSPLLGRALPLLGHSRRHIPVILGRAGEAIQDEPRRGRGMRAHAGGEEGWYGRAGADLEQADGPDEPKWLRHDTDTPKPLYP